MPIARYLPTISIFKYNPESPTLKLLKLPNPEIKLLYRRYILVLCMCVRASVLCLNYFLIN